MSEADEPGCGETVNPSAKDQENPTTMLEVHAPHSGIHSWRDFFIHIATITIGLLIAIGLEQTVEYFHHLDQLKTARRELAVELGENREILKFNREQLNTQKRELTRDMTILIASRDSHAPLQGALDYRWVFKRPREGAWQVARQNGTLELMPHTELQNYAHWYDSLDGIVDPAFKIITQMTHAAAIARRSPNGELSPRDLDELITVTSDAQGDVDALAELIDFIDKTFQLVNWNALASAAICSATKPCTAQTVQMRDE